MAPEGLAGRPVSSALPDTAMPAPAAMVSAPAAVKVDLAAPAPNWASPATSSLAPGAGVPTPAVPSRWIGLPLSVAGATVLPTVTAVLPPIPSSDLP